MTRRAPAEREQEVVAQIAAFTAIYGCGPPTTELAERLRLSAAQTQCVLRRLRVRGEVVHGAAGWTGVAPRGDGVFWAIPKPN